jgi:uncharacterized membrane protein YdjX (TVP38/TMEM64 family)
MEPVQKHGGSWRPVLLLGAVAVMLPVLGAAGLLEPMRTAAGLLREQGLSGALAFALVAAGLCGVAVLPTHAVSLLAGYVLGLALGVPAAVVGVLGGTLLGYELACRLSAPRLRALIDARPSGRALARAMVDATGWRAVMAVTLVRLPPQVPFALGNVLAAGTGVRRGPLLAGTALGMLPRITIVVALGAQLAAWDLSRTSPWMIAAAVAGAVLGLGGLGVWSWLIVRRSMLRRADAAS